MTEREPTFIAVKKLRDLQDRGFQTCGALLAGGDPARFVGLTDHGKVIWWPGNPPAPHDLIDRLKRAHAAMKIGVLKFPDLADLIDEAATEIHVLEMALQGLNDLYAQRPRKEPE